MLLFLLFSHSIDTLLGFDALQIPRNAGDFLCMGNEGVMEERNPIVCLVVASAPDKPDIFL